jgi:hypothetical protein
MSSGEVPSVAARLGSSLLVCLPRFGRDRKDWLTGTVEACNNKGGDVCHGEVMDAVERDAEGV